MNSHLVIKETLKDKLACSYRKASLYDGVILYFIRASDASYLRALSRIKAAFYYEWSKAKKELEFFMMVSVRYSKGGDVEDILDIDHYEDGEHLLATYDEYWAKYYPMMTDIDKDDLVIPFISIVHPSKNL